MTNNIIRIGWNVILVLFTIIALIFLGILAYYLINNRSNGKIVSSGEERLYLIHVPDSYDPAIPTPLVLSFHGFIEWPAHQAQLSGWNEVADQNGFIVVYPMGSGFPLRWRTTIKPAGEGSLPIDVQFISDLIDKLENEYNIDPTRIYANGMSNGGGMTFLLACTLSDRIAAIGGVAGAYMTDWQDCRPSRPVPGIFFHGTEDNIVPYNGGRYERSDTFFPVIPEWVGEWAAVNGCKTPPQEIARIDDISGVIYSACENDARVILYTIHGGGHTWPGGNPLPEFITGKTTQSINATKEMWDFYKNFRLDLTKDQDE